MVSKRLVRVNELLQHEVAQQLFRVMNDQGFDVSAVTVTGVETTSDLRTARVLISIRGTPEQQQAMMAQIAGHRKEIQEILGENVILKYTPRLTFELDPSIARGDHVLGLIARIEEDHPEWKKEGGSGSPPPATDPASP